jgi:hypothetical protein
MEMNVKLSLKVELKKYRSSVVHVVLVKYFFNFRQLGRTATPKILYVNRTCLTGLYYISFRCSGLARHMSPLEMIIQQA